MGAKTEPCGTPLFTSVHLDIFPFTFTRYLLLVKNDFIQLRSLPLMPYDSTFLIKRKRGTESNAFAKSV